MLHSKDFRFLSVFLLNAWLGLRFNKSALADFEKRCISSDAEPEEKVRTGLAIMKEALRSKEKDRKHRN